MQNRNILIILGIGIGGLFLWKYLKKDQVNGLVGDNLGDHTATQDLNMGGFPVVNVAEPFDSSDVTTKNYVDNAIDGLSFEGDNLGDHTATQDLNMGGFPVVNVAEPFDSSDVATKNYVDSLDTGGDIAHGFDSSNSVEFTSSTSYVDYNPINCPIETNGGNVLVMASLNCFNLGAQKFVSYRLTRDDETVNSITNAVGNPYSDVTYTPETYFGGSVVWIDTPPSGHHNYELQYRTSSGGTAYMFNVSISAIELRI